MDLLNLFYNITNIKPDKIILYPFGITNTNYIVKAQGKEYFLRIPKENQIGLNRQNEKFISNQIASLKIDAPIIYLDENTGIKISKKINYINYFDNPNNTYYLELFFKQLKKIHHMDISNFKKFDVFELLKIYKKHTNDKTISFKNEELLLSKVKQLYKKYPLVLCHNDLLFANLLCTKKKVHIIDYEYAGLNIVLFDIMSFIKENNIDNISTQIKIFKTYFGKINIDLISDLNTMGLFLDLFWAYWAYMNYKIYEDNLYLDIFMEKYQRYHKTITHI